MKYIDAHLHLDSRNFDNPFSAAESLNNELEAANIEKALLLHLNIQGWSAEDIDSIICKYPRIEAFFNVEPTDKNACQQLSAAISTMNFCGLKLHPRLQKFDMNCSLLVELCRHAGDLGVPVLIDAFPDGSGLMHGFNVLEYSTLAKNCPNTRFIWAHMGGHHVIDMMMLAKRLENVYFDFSFSLLYFQGSSIPQNIVYAMNSMRFERIFYGSDYPDRSIETTLLSSIEVLKNLKVNDIQLEKLLYSNFKEFMAW